MKTILSLLTIILILVGLAICFAVIAGCSETPKDHAVGQPIFQWNGPTAGSFQSNPPEAPVTDSPEIDTAAYEWLVAYVKVHPAARLFTKAAMQDDKIDIVEYYAIPKQTVKQELLLECDMINHGDVERNPLIPDPNGPQ